MRIQGFYRSCSDSIELPLLAAFPRPAPLSPWSALNVKNSSVAHRLRQRLFVPPSEGVRLATPRKGDLANFCSPLPARRYVARKNANPQFRVGDE